MNKKEAWTKYARAMGGEHFESSGRVLTRVVPWVVVLEDATDDRWSDSTGGANSRMSASFRPLGDFCFRVSLASPYHESLGHVLKRLDIHRGDAESCGYDWDFGATDRKKLRGLLENRWIRDFPLDRVPDGTLMIEVRPEESEVYSRLTFESHEILRDPEALAQLHQVIEEIMHQLVAIGVAAKPQSSLLDFDLAIERYPERAGAYFARGAEFSERNEFKLAIADFGRAIQIEPNYPEAYCERGVANRALEEYGPAFADFDMAIYLEPTYAEAYYERALAYSDLDYDWEASEDMELARKLTDDDDLLDAIDDYWQGW